MTSTDLIKLDNVSQLSGYHPPRVDIPPFQIGYHLLQRCSSKVKISLPGSDSE